MRLPQPSRRKAAYHYVPRLRALNYLFPPWFLRNLVRALLCESGHTQLNPPTHTHTLFLFPPTILPLLLPSFPSLPLPSCIRSNDDRKHAVPCMTARVRRRKEKQNIHVGQAPQVGKYDIRESRQRVGPQIQPLELRQALESGRRDLRDPIRIVRSVFKE